MVINVIQASTPIALMHVAMGQLQAKFKQVRWPKVIAENRLQKRAEMGFKNIQLQLDKLTWDPRGQWEIQVPITAGRCIIMVASSKELV